MSVSGASGVLVDPGGIVLGLAADTTREVFYASLSTNEVVRVGVAPAGVGLRTSVGGVPGALKVSPDGTKLFVALTDVGNVAVYALPGMAPLTTYTLSSADDGPTDLVVTADRLYVGFEDGFAVVDTNTGVELYFGEPGSSTSFHAGSPVLALSPDERTLYAMTRGLSPASLYGFDVSHLPPVLLGEDCCHGCLGGNGQDLTVAADGEQVYAAVGGERHLQVLSAKPMFVKEYAGLTGPSAALARSSDGTKVFVGVHSEGLTVVRTSDWLPFHMRTLANNSLPVRTEMELSQNEETLAILSATSSPFSPDRIELVDVTSLPANQGGVRLRPRDSQLGIPPVGARESEHVFTGESAYFRVADGVLGRAPMAPGSYLLELSAPGYTTVAVPGASVVAGAWTDLGEVAMVRTGAIPRPAEVCSSPPAQIGTQSTIMVRGLGFYPGAGLEVLSQSADLQVESFEFVDWSTIRTAVAVDPSVAPGTGEDDIRVNNPDGQGEPGHVAYGYLDFADGFESGDTSAWSFVTP